MRARLILATFALLLAALDQPAGAQILKPTSPLNPTSAGQCDALAKAWQIVSVQTGKRHDSCFNELETGAHMDSHQTRCSFPQCQPWHGHLFLGLDEVGKCRADVAAHMKKERDEKARKDSIAKVEKDRATKDDKQRAAEAERQQKEAEQQEREATSAEAQREKERRERQEAREARTSERDQRLKDAMDEKREQWDRTFEQNKKREADQRALEAKQDKNSSTLTRLVDGSVQAMEAAARGLRESLGNIGSRTETTRGSDFDFAAEPSRFEKGLSTLFDNSSALVPFAGIPLSLAKNASLNTLDLANQLGRTIDNFDTADPRELEAAFAAYPEKALGPRALLGAIFDHLSASAEKYQEDDPVTEAVALRLRMSLSKGPAGSLFKETPMAGRRVDFWWERSSPAPLKTVRDSRGTTLLFDRNGSLYNYDAAAGRARYDSWDVERLVASGDLMPRRLESRPPTMTRRSVIFNPTFDPSEYRSLPDKGVDWVAGQLTGGVTPPTEQLRKLLLDKLTPERKP